MPKVGSAAPRTPRAPPPEMLRSGDFVPALSKPTTPAEKKKLGAQADRAIAHQLNEAKAVFHPDLKAVYAEEAGNLLAIRRSLAGHPRGDEADTQKLAGQVKALLLEIVSLRVEGMKQIAAHPAGPDAIRKGESEASSLELDLSRVYRFGFDKPQVDVRALDQAIKKAVVEGVIGRGRSGGWSPP